MDFVEPKLDELQKPDEFIPSWFKLSPSMLTYSFDQCGQKFIYKYIHKMTSKDTSPSLSRTMAFRHAIFNWENYVKRDIDDAIEDAVRGYFWSIAKTIADEYKIDKPKDLSEMIRILSNHYKWSKKIPSPGVLIDQCITSAKEVLEYMKDIIPAYEQQHMISELVCDGEILDETFGRPTQFQTTLQFVSTQNTIYIFKIADSRMYTKNMACYISDEPALMSTALQQYILKNKDVNVPRFDVVILRAVVNNGGGCTVLEEHKKSVNEVNISDVLHKAADAAKDIKSVRLHKKPQLSCAWCEYKDPCLFKNTSKFQMPASEAIYDREVEAKFDDDDDLPY